MKNSKHALLALLTVVSAGAASAQSMNKDSGYYAEVGYFALQFKSDQGGDVTPKLARLIVGKDLYKNLSAEVMYASTVSKVSDDYGYSYTGATYGVYLKPKTVVTAGTDVFARVGAANTTLNIAASPSSRNESVELPTSKFAYGLGVQTQFTNDVYGQVDYMDFGKKDGISGHGFTVSVGMRF